MAQIPIWLKLLRLYCHHSPVDPGKYRLVLWAWTHFQATIPTAPIDAALDGILWTRLYLKNWVDFNIYCIGLYEHYLVWFFKQELKHDMVFLDVGAYIGQYALLAAYYAPDGHAYAFEPHHQSATRLQEAASRNNLSNLTVTQTAVGSQVGEASFYVSPEASMSSIMPDHSAHQTTATVPITTLDDFCTQNHLDQVALVKIDVENAEGAVIRGGLDTLARFQPLIIIEIGGTASPSEPSEALVALNQLGYRFFQLQRHQLQPFAGNWLRSTDNIIAVPAGRQDDFR